MGAESLGLGRATAAVSDRWYLPRIYREGPPVIFMNGGDFTAVDGPTSARDIVEAVVDAGFRVVQPSVPLMFGNATAVARVDDAVAYARTVLGCTDDPPVVMGVSNGCVCALSYARQRAVAGLVGILPPVDLQGVYAANTWDLRAAIAAAWGVVYPAALPAGASAAQVPGDFVGKKLDLWYASDDPLTQAAPAFIAATGATGHDVGLLGHTDAAVLAVDAEQVARFVTAVAG